VLRIIRGAVSRFRAGDGVHATEAAVGAGRWLATVARGAGRAQVRGWSNRDANTSEPGRRSPLWTAE
jgi:hypothetical protein